MNKDILTRPFAAEQIRQRPGSHGKVISYVEAHAVVSRLNEGCDSWSFEIVKHEVLADEVIVVGRLVADGVMKMAFGGSSVTRDGGGKEFSIADDLKAASSDALKKCASLLGVGLEMYGATAASPTRAWPSVPTAPRPDFDDRLTTRQLSAIHAAARRKGLQQLNLASMLKERFGKDGAQHLTRKEASDFISELSGTNGG